MKLLISTYILIFLFTFQHWVINNEKPVKSSIPDSTITITLSAVGDIMCHSVQFEYAKVSEDSFNFNPVFREVKEYLSKSDFTFGNLETVFAGKKAKYTGYPRFNSPVELLDALQNTGFDLLTTSNNHSLDRDEFGILRTIEELNKWKLNYNGTYISQRDRDSIRIFSIKGITIVFLAYSYDTNGNPIPKGKSYLINLINLDLIRHDIQAAKALNPDLILVHYHFGEEYKREPSDFQKAIVDSTIKMGADVIIGGHPHVLQPIEFIKANNSELDSVFIAYSLGNFISNQRKRFTDAGGILTLHITKNIFDHSIKISEVEFIPTWVFKGKTNLKNEYIILPSEFLNKDTSLSILDQNSLSKMKEAINDTKEILSKYSDVVRFN